MKKNCIFCGLIKGQVQSHKIYEDKYCFAFLDIHPINPGHILVVSKKHIADFYKLDEKNYLELMSVVRKLSTIVNENMKPKKVGLIIAGWDVPHTHIHIIPMKHYHDITSKSLLEGKKSNPTDNELAKIAKKLKQK